MKMSDKLIAVVRPMSANGIRLDELEKFRKALHLGGVGGGDKSIPLDTTEGDAVRHPYNKGTMQSLELATMGEHSSRPSENGCNIAVRPMSKRKKACCRLRCRATDTWQSRLPNCHH